MKRCVLLALVILVPTPGPALLAVQTADPPVDLDRLRQKPITTDAGKVGVLLKAWWQEGTAAGNAGDFYDNRDADHSPLNLAPYPQMSAFKYAPADVKLMKHWAAARVVRPHVTFGNSSTSAPAHLGGSNPRSYYVSQAGLAFLHEQYRKNNLYIYPEHRDHDPGRNGVGLYLSPGIREEGYGDMYPTNTPYLIISQGSSGSDQPFMRMLPYVLAAFRPEVKKKLTETGLLMPTIQMLMRSTNKHLKDPKEYLTGKAHPTVFEGSWLDELAMVQKAHAIELKALPPMARLRVVEEGSAINGIDYFDRPSTEVLANTPGCIARIHRGKACTKRLVVSAEASFDVNKSKLTYTWVILRGDSDKIKIVPKKDDQSVAEITVAYHDRRPVFPGSPLESNRVDIGVFVHNGAHYSAPAFVTVCTLDREVRTYDKDGKVLEIAHGTGETEIRVKDWGALLLALRKDDDAQLFHLGEKLIEGLRIPAEDQAVRSKNIHDAKAKVRKIEMELKNAKDAPDKERTGKELDGARKKVNELQQERNAALERKYPELLGDSPRRFVESRLAKLTQDPLFTLKHADWLKKNRTPASEALIKSHWQKLARFGIANDKELLTPLLPGKTLADAKWTKFELAQLEAFHASLLADLAFPGMVEVIFRVNYVDHRLSAPREWRDIYRYDAKEEPIGWIRYSTKGVQRFNHEGLLVIEKDGQGRCVKGQVVGYVQDPWKGQGINLKVLRMVPGDTIVRYEFDGAADLRGRRAGTEATKDAKK